MAAEIGGVDVQAVGISITVVGGFIGAIWAGIRQGVKKVQANEADPGARLAAGVLMDNASMTLLSERLREVSEQIGHLRGDMRENSHQIERLRDKL